MSPAAAVRGHTLRLVSHGTKCAYPLKDGYVEVPTAPGLGVDLDPEIVARFTVSTSR